MPFLTICLLIAAVCRPLPVTFHRGESAGSLALPGKGGAGRELSIRLFGRSLEGVLLCSVLCRAGCGCAVPPAGERSRLGGCVTALWGEEASEELSMVALPLLRGACCR